MLTFAFMVGKQTGNVEFIVMASDNFLIRALPNVAMADKPPLDYWITCLPEELAPYLSSDYEVWMDDLSSESDEPGSGGDLDPEDELAWQIEPVQMWAKGQVVSRDFVANRSMLLGLGDEFTFGDFAAEFPFHRPAPKPKLEKPSRSKTDRVCPWCAVTAVRRYNFSRPDYSRESEMPEWMENPVLWTDGAWSEGGIDPDSTEFIENQYGDCVVACPACNAMFLASMVEPYDSIVYKAPNYYEGQLGPDQLAAVLEHVVPGTVAKGHFDKTLSEEWIVTATLDQTLEYLEDVFDKQGPFWSEWTAAQQLVNWVSYLVRTGESITPEQDQRGREALVQFIKSTGGILEGVFGSFYAYNNHWNESSDENYWIHTHALQEAIPFTNIRRIAGAVSELNSFPPSNVLGIYTLEELDGEPTYDFDEYIVRRQLLLHELIARNDSRWAVHSGELKN